VAKNRRKLFIWGGIAAFALLVLVIAGFVLVGEGRTCDAAAYPYTLYVFLPDPSITTFSVSLNGSDGKSASVSCPVQSNGNQTPWWAGGTQTSCRQGEAVFTGFRSPEVTVMAKWSGANVSWVVRPVFQQAPYQCSGGQADIVIPKSVETPQATDPASPGA